MTDVGYGISAKFRIDDSDLLKVERRLNGIAKSMSGIKASLVDALYGREVRSALDQLERRVAGVASKAARAGRSGAMGGAAAAAVASPGFGLEAPWAWRRARTFYGGDRAGGVPPPPGGWQGPYRPPAPRQIGGPVTPIPQYNSWQGGWRGFGHPTPGNPLHNDPQYGPVYDPLRAGIGYGAGPVSPKMVRAGSRIAGGIMGGAALAGAGALAGGYSLAEGAIDTQREAEMGRQGITAALAAFGGVPIGDAQARSGNIYSKLERIAAVGPGETSDYAFGFQRVFGPLSQRGASDEAIMSLVSQSIAGGSMLWGSAGAKFGPMDIMQALTSGLTDRTTPLASMAVQSAGFTSEQFAGADDAGKLRMLVLGFEKLQPALAVLSRTVDAQEHTFNDAMKRMVRTISDPAYELYRQNLIGVNDAMTSGHALRQDEIESIRKLVTGLTTVTEQGLVGFMKGLDHGRESLQWGADAWSETLGEAGSTTARYTEAMGTLVSLLAGFGAWFAAKQTDLLLAGPAAILGAGMRQDNRLSVPGMPMMGGAGMPHDLRVSQPFRMEGEILDYDMVAATPGAEWAFNEYGPADMRSAADKARSAIASGSGRNREITIRIADFKVDVTEPRAIARSYKRVVSDALSQLARTGLNTATDGVVL